MNRNSLFSSIVSYRNSSTSSRWGVALVSLIVLTGCNRDLEQLDRGLIVVPAEQGNAVSWRALGDDAPNTTFDVYRNGNKLNGNPIDTTTFYMDTEGEKGDTYQIHTLIGQREHQISAEVSALNQPYLQIPLNKPRDNFVNGQRYSYVANDGSAADLDGDGQYELIVKWEPSNAQDNSRSGATGNVLIDAYTLEGKRLWRINLGPNIRAGAHYTQFIAYDFDQDGLAEIAMKTADGTVDGRGNVVGDGEALYRNGAGYVLDGPEYLTVFNGLTGEALDTVDYIPARGDVQGWGDDYGNRVDRFLAGVAYLDGKTPSLLMARGYYTRAVVAAFDWNGKNLTSRWVFDTNNGNGDEVVFGQGSHSLHVADVDRDGKDEVVYGAATIDDNGHILYSTGLCHGDAVHVSDLDPQRAGLEVFMVHEDVNCYANEELGYDHGFEMHDAATGEILWSRSGEGRDVGRGVSANIDPRYVGNESWSSRGGLVSADGQDISSAKPTSTNFVIYWDGDLLRELLDRTSVSKWDYLNQEEQVLFDASPFGAVSNNGTKATPMVSADLLGDWREEVVWANSDSSALMLFSSSIPTNHRLPTLMHDPQYRMAIAWQNVGYNQPPHPSFYLGESMETPPATVIKTLSPKKGMQLVARSYDNAIGLTLYAFKESLDGAEIYRSTHNNFSRSSRVAALSEGESDFTDSDVEPDTRYYYWAELTDKAQSRKYGRLSANAVRSGNDDPFYDVVVNSDDGPATLSWLTENIDIAQINIFRQPAQTNETVPDAELRQLVGSPSIIDTSWTDTSAQPGENFYYWVEFIDTEGNAFGPAPEWVRYVLPTTSLSTAYRDGAVEITWDLENFPPIQNIQLYRNTVDQLSGRGRLSPGVNVSGSFSDATVQSNNTYWYMFKITLEDGSTLNTEPEGEISIP